MSGIRSVRVALPPPIEGLELALNREFATRAESDLQTVAVALYQASSVFATLGGLAGEIADAEMEAMGLILSRGMRDLARNEGETLDALALALRQAFAAGKPHPDDPKPSTPEMES